MTMPQRPRRKGGVGRNPSIQCRFITGIILLLSVVCINVWSVHEQIHLRDVENNIPLLADWKQEAHNQNQNQNQTINSKTKTKHTSRPLEMLQEYQQFHSQSVLLEEHQHQNGGIGIGGIGTGTGTTGIHNRTFVVGLYACPDAAGNRLHEFFNNMILAIAHNYTISWKFFDELTCRAVGTKAGWKFCKFPVNSLETCGEVVERASWVAPFDEWSEKLNLPFGERSKVKEFYSPSSNKLELVQDHQKKEFNIIPNDNKVWIPKERNIPLSLEKQGQVKDPMAIERMKELYSMGTYYLYGMLFHEIFPFHESVKPSADLMGVDEDEISIVLHSRHVKDHLDGMDVSKETQCIQNIIDQHEAIGNNLDKCKIFLMSDRNATLEGLKEWIPQHTKCRPVIARHEVERGLFPEHGPFAMKGFFRDLALAAHTNGGFIGALADQKCSSADLIRDLYEYNHYVLNDGRDNVGSPLHCGIPKHK